MHNLVHVFAQLFNPNDRDDCFDIFSTFISILRFLEIIFRFKILLKTAVLSEFQNEALKPEVHKMGGCFRSRRKVNML